MGLCWFCVVPTLAANFSTSVGFLSAPESPGCSKSRTDNNTAVCYAALNDSQGTSLVSIYQKGANTYVALGSIEVTQPATSSTTVTASLSATLTEFSGLTSGGVTLTDNCTQDCEPITVAVNGVQVGLLCGGGRTTLSIPYVNQPLLIQLSAQERALKPGIDYVGAFNITAIAY